MILTMLCCVLQSWQKHDTKALLPVPIFVVDYPAALGKYGRALQARLEGPTFVEFVTEEFVDDVLDMGLLRSVYGSVSSKEARDSANSLMQLISFDALNVALDPTSEITMVTPSSTIAEEFAYVVGLAYRSSYDSNPQLTPRISQLCASLNRRPERGYVPDRVRTLSRILGASFIIDVDKADKEFRLIGSQCSESQSDLKFTCLLHRKRNANSTKLFKLAQEANKEMHKRFSQFCMYSAYNRPVYPLK